MLRRSQMLFQTLRRNQAGSQEYQFTHVRGRGGKHIFGGVLLGLGAGYIIWGSERRQRFWAERAAHFHHCHGHGHGHGHGHSQVCPTCFYEKHGHYPQAVQNGSQTGGGAPPSAPYDASTHAPGFPGTSTLPQEEKPSQ